MTSLYKIRLPQSKPSFLVDNFRTFSIEHIEVVEPKNKLGNTTYSQYLTYCGVRSNWDEMHGGFYTWEDLPENTCQECKRLARKLLRKYKPEYLKRTKFAAGAC